MKKFSFLLALVFLASCGEAQVDEAAKETDLRAEVYVSDESDSDDDSSEDDSNDEQEEEDDVSISQDSVPVVSEPVAPTLEQEINDEVAALENVVEDKSKTVTVDAPYNNPKGLVDMQVSYTLGSDGTITEIGVSATTYQGLGNFNTAIQSLIGSTLEEASEYVSSSSMTGPAFTAALKSQL